MVTRILITAAAVVASMTAARAQELPVLPDARQVPPPSMQPAPPAAATAPTVVQMTPEKLQRIYHIRQLEGMLTNAVKAGASTVAYQMQMAEPSLFVTTNARTRGFELEGFGVFFDVDVPSMLQSAVYSVQARQEQLKYADMLRATVADVRVNPAMRRMAEIELNRLQRQLGMAPPGMAGPQAAAQGQVVAQTTDVPASPVVAPLPDLRDPNERYTDAIKEKLIDAMLTYGNALRLDDQEWLVIAARATSDTMPGQLDDAASILLRIKGADLNAYLLKKIGRDEVIKKIEIKIG